VTATLVNALGQTVRTMHERRVSATADLAVEIRTLPSSIYFLRAEGETFTDTEKFTIVR